MGRKTIRFCKAVTESVETAINEGRYVSFSQLVREAVDRELKRGNWYEKADADQSQLLRGDGGTHWKDQDKCQGCGAPKRTIGRDNPDNAKDLRAIVMIEGPTELRCKECFETAIDEGRVSPEDPRISDNT